jgi:hypothetical protein
MYIDGVVFGLLDTSSKIPESKLSERLRNFTISWSRYGYHDTILENDSLDDLLREALGLGYRYCLIQSYGHVIGETWIPKHWQQADFQTALKEWIDDHDFFVTGTILTDADGWFGLRDDCLLVNLEHYARLGLPDYGYPQDRIVEVVKPSMQMDARTENERLYSLEYTALTETVMPRHAGWNFIEASLRNKLPVYNFSKALDDNRIYLLDPSREKMKAFTGFLGTELGNYTRAEKNEISQDQKHFLDSIHSQVRESRKGVFLFNLESYKDVLERPAQFTPPLSSLYSVAAGFKPNMMLHSLGFDETTRMVFFDYSNIALEIRKIMVSEWGGDDFPEFIRYLMKNYPPGEVFYQLWANLTPDQIDWDDLERLWLDEVEKWGGESVFREHWIVYRNLEHEYIHCNLLDQPNELLATVHKIPNAAIWWSNAFFTIYSNWLYTAEQRKKIYDEWLMKLAECNPEIFIYGSDYNNINVNHIRLGEYLKRYQAECSNYLQPCRLYKHALRL